MKVLLVTILFIFTNFMQITVWLFNLYLCNKNLDSLISFLNHFVQNSCFSFPLGVSDIYAPQNLPSQDTSC